MRTLLHVPEVVVRPNLSPERALALRGRPLIGKPGLERRVQVRAGNDRARILHEVLGGER